MYTPGKLDAVMDSDFGLGFLPIPKRTLFADDKQTLNEDDDSGLGMEVDVLKNMCLIHYNTPTPPEIINNKKLSFENEIYFEN